MRLLLTSLLMLSATLTYAADTSTRIFDQSMRSLRACLETDYYAPPVIELGGDDRVRVEFDDINSERRYMRYSLLHCDAAWQPSQIVESDYVDGFNQADVEDYEFSSGTFEQYVHYGISLPNQDMPILLSGNYLLKVYLEDDPDCVLLQQRFCVVEKRVGIGAAVSSRTDVDYNDSHQQISITINTANWSINNPYSDLRVVVSQNQRTDNEVMVTQPLRVSGNTIVFDHDRQLIFPGGNEFRRFEMVTTNYAGMGVERYTYSHPYHHAVLETDEPRAFESYSFDRTQYGRFTIRESNSYDSNTQADYMITHFSLAMPRLVDGDVYVDGEFTQHRFANSNRMHYNVDTQCYELDLPLKQGVYNYQYLWLPNGMNVAQTAKIEGDHYQTVNEYMIRAYYRVPGERYDRLIGYGLIYSGH